MKTNIRFLLTASLVFATAAWSQADWSANNITVSTEAELKELLHWVDYGHDFSGKIIKLGADITLADKWKPIGSEKNQFKGTFDGDGKSISELSISGVRYAGLFGYVGDGGQIKNLVVNVVSITATTYAGGLAAYYASNKAIENCGVNIRDSIFASSYSGGLVGEGGGDEIIIINSYVTGNISAIGTSHGSYSYSGGLVGYSKDGAITIINSHATSNISVSSTFSYSGGLVGRNCDNRGVITINNSYATGNVSANGNYAHSGGLIGSCRSGAITINNSYATGNISTNGSSSSYSGGLVGYSSDAATISNSYATGNISTNGSSSSYSGGLVGSIISIRINNSYTTGNVSGGDYSGGLVGYMGYNYRYSEVATIRNSYATGSISGKYSGGLIGETDRPLEIRDCYVTGNVSGESYSGGLLGRSRRDSSSIINSYAIGDVSGSNIVGGLVGTNQGKIENSYIFGKITVGIFSTNVAAM